MNCLCYRSFERLEDLARLLPQVRILANPVALKNKLDDKVLFRHMLPKLKVGRLKGESAPLERLEFGTLENRYGLPFVIQFPFGSAGDFTFLVKEAAELNTLKKDNPTLTVNVIPFLDRPCLNINACILDDGRGPFILASPPSIQLIGLPEASSGGLTFCGNDFSALDSIPMARRIETQELTKRIGLWMASQGYRGLFGLDLLVDETCVYPVEINPRFQNSTSLLTHLSTERGDIPLTACHTSEFLPGAPRPSPKERAEQSQKDFVPLEGAQIILHNLLSRPVRVKGTLRPGIYDVSNNQLRYLRPGLAFENLNGAGECLITCGIPGPQKRVLPKAPLLKLQTRSQVLTPDLKRLSPWANRLVGLTTRTLEMEPEAAMGHGL